MTDTPLPVDVADLRPGDRFTFGAPKNQQCTFLFSDGERVYFRTVKGGQFSYAVPIKGARVYRA